MNGFGSLFITVMLPQAAETYNGPDQKKIIPTRGVAIELQELSQGRHTAALIWCFALKCRTHETP